MAFGNPNELYIQIKGYDCSRVYSGTECSMHTCQRNFSICNTCEPCSEVGQCSRAIHLLVGIKTLCFSSKGATAPGVLHTTSRYGLSCRAYSPLLRQVKLEAAVE